MGTNYQLLAAHYPFQGYYEDGFQCSTLLAALKKFLEYKLKGYEIIDMHYREFIKVDTSDWNQITLG
jgi:hypothetical protein